MADCDGAFTVRAGASRDVVPAKSLCRNSEDEQLSQRPNLRRRGFTLSEVTVSAFIIGIVMVGIGSAVMISTEALPDPEDPAQAATDAAAIADQIVEELRYAKVITERSGSVIAFAVADRNGDGAPERIRYAWSGTAGAPLTREYNGGGAIEIAQNVEKFALSYHLDAVTEEYPGPMVESLEQLFNGNPTGASSNNEYVKTDKWVGQYFKPTLPNGAETWKLTRVEFEARKHGGSDGEMSVQLWKPGSDNLPGDSLLAEQPLLENTLSGNYQWQSFSFNLEDLLPTEGVCLVIKGVSGGGDIARIHYGDTATGEGKMFEGNGATWSFEETKNMVYSIYGTSLAPGPPQTARRRYLTAVRVALQIGGDASTGSVSATPALNRPELLEAFWELDFNTAPTIDHNGDAQPDWSVRTGNFNADSLNAGVWNADTILDTKPNNDFSELTTVNVRFRNTSQGGNGAVFQMNADWTGGSSCAPLFALARLQSDGTQTLSVNHYESGGAVPLIEIPGLPAGFITLRLLIDPDLDTANVNVNGLDVGTYLYNTVSPPNSDRFATIRRSGSNAEFDFVSVRVSEDNG
ncbi:MAG: prepilin-type N-terminal cleavage/methylation domain-containing protein [Phycisphaerales bacterium]|nr:prepilin-type N-terminal cleavage/methylation domain-containing protein [Phycisphaerales bacterium]